MKNILKKIGVIGIIIAILAPFVEMPVVKAAETQTCSDHTVLQYYFTDVTLGNNWRYYTGNGYATYTIFPYTFPEESGKTINILKTQLLNIETSETTSSDNSMTVANFWSDVRSLQNTKNYQISGNEIAGNYVTKDKSDYKVVKLLHGIWGRETDSGYESADWKNVPDNDNDLRDHSVQNIFSKNEATLTISSARYLGNGSTNLFGRADENSLDEYFKNLVSSDNKEYIKEENGEKVFALRVNRQISLDTLNSKSFGYACGKFKNEKGEEVVSCDDDHLTGYAIFTTDDAAKEIKNSFTAFINNSTTASPRKYVSNENEINIKTSDDYYWPAVLTVEYEVCTNTSEKWTLKYDGNTDDNSANNIPEKVQKNVGEDAEIDSKTPTRNGYTFKGWNTEKNGSGKTYNAGNKYESPDSADVIVLYAQWGDASKGEQKSTGVASYIIGFISVGIVAGGIYLIAKKKNLFKQI